MTNDTPLWLARAWRIRALVLVALLLAVVIGYLTGKDRGDLPPYVFGAIAAMGAALIWIDWHWLKRNHHRINSWGLSKGKDARKKPK